MFHIPKLPWLHKNNKATTMSHTYLSFQYRSIKMCSITLQFTLGRRFQWSPFSDFNPRFWFQNSQHWLYSHSHKKYCFLIPQDYTPPGPDTRILSWIVNSNTLAVANESLQNNDHEVDRPAAQTHSERLLPPPHTPLHVFIQLKDYFASSSMHPSGSRVITKYLWTTAAWGNAHLSL